MSSTDESPDCSNQQNKRKKRGRACDRCRRRKIRCDGSATSPNKCSYCISQGSECTFTYEPKKRGRPKGYLETYVEGLEKRITLLEGLIRKLCPDQMVLHNLIHPLDPEYAAELANTRTSTASSSNPTMGSLEQVESEKQISDKDISDSLLDVIHKVTSLSLGSTDDPFRDLHSDVSERTKSLAMSPETGARRFYGNGGGSMLIEAAITLKNECSKDVPIKRIMLQNKRPVLWKRFSWESKEVATHPTVKYDFPPPDLIAKLSDAYFEHVNLFYPLLHRPTFERAIDGGLHFRDEGFASVLLLVCAVGSRHSESIDVRTMADGTDVPLSSGWKWYNQVQVVKQRSFDPPTLYDLQLYCLAALFTSGCYSPQTVWILTGFGIRLAQDVGAHRRRVALDKLTVEDELWKRAFWVLLVLDRMVSWAIGRPCATSDDHFDLDMPVECDDEYWENSQPSLRFKQPDHIPSTVTAFNHLLRLLKIMAFAMGTVYSIKSKLWDFLLKDQWEKHIEIAMNSALNKWINALPDYLRWDPYIDDEKFLRLSGSLITTFYYVKMIIHRPHLAAKEQRNSRSLFSLAICNSAARSCSVILEQQLQRFTVIYPFMQQSAAISAIVILLNIWGNKQNGVTAEPIENKHMEICMTVLGKAEDRWRSAGIFLDILRELTAAGQLITEEELGCLASSSTNGIGFQSTEFGDTCRISDGYRYSGTSNEENSSHDNAYYASIFEQEILLGRTYFPQTQDILTGISSNIQDTYINSNYERSELQQQEIDMWSNIPCSDFQINDWNSFFDNY